MNRDSLIFAVVILVLLLALFSVNSPTLSGSPPPTDTPFYWYDLTLIAQTEEVQ